LQITDLSSGELKWLANHMGHNVNIHENVYRLHDSVIELAKVSRLLMAADAGKIAQFAGKKLQEINLQGKYSICFVQACFGRTAVERIQKQAWGLQVNLHDILLNNISPVLQQYMWLILCP
jgi:hypothetical protein